MSKQRHSKLYRQILLIGLRFGERRNCTHFNSSIPYDFELVDSWHLQRWNTSSASYIGNPPISSSDGSQSTQSSPGAGTMQVGTPAVALAAPGPASAGTAHLLAAGAAPDLSHKPSIADFMARQNGILILRPMCSMERLAAIKICAISRQSWRLQIH